MADDGNLVLRLLREIGEKQGEDSLRLQRVERRLGELRVTVILAVSSAMQASRMVEESGERLDEVNERIDAPSRRVAELEAQRQ